MAFHLGCLRALHDLGVLDHIAGLSTISGGSVVGAYYAYTPGKSFIEFESDIRGFLRKGFSRAIIAELFKPGNACRSLANVVTASANVLGRVIAKRPPKCRARRSRTDLFEDILRHRLFPNLKMGSPRRGMEIFVGACDLRTESGFRFGNAASGSWRLGRLIQSNIDVALAVAASAAYPLFLPALDRNWVFYKDGVETEHRVLLSDGGLYDNLGVRVFEPDRDPAICLHTFPCDYVIVCNAGHGQALGATLPTRSYGRMATAFSMVHRLVGNATMQRLHDLKRTGRLRGFALPYLGQLDEELPARPEGLIRRSEVIVYPTDFSAMSDAWIDRLSKRGEQLTRISVLHYLRDLL